MLLCEMLGCKCVQEDVEIYVRDTKEMYKHSFKMPKGTYSYEVVSWYSVWNESKKDTKTHIEVIEL